MRISQKCFIFVITFILVVFVSCASQQEVVEQASYTVGDRGPAGGFIFYVDKNNDFPWTYMEAAPADWMGDAVDPAMTWADAGSLIGATNDGIGTGLANTEKIAEAMPDSAAAFVLKQSINGLTGWFLPSLTELNEMYEVLYRKGLGDLRKETYWSSTERNDDRAMTKSFSTAGQISTTKSHERHIRPVRVF